MVHGVYKGMAQECAGQLTVSVYTVPHCTVSTQAMAAAAKRNFNFLKEPNRWVRWHF